MRRQSEPGVDVKKKFRPDSLPRPENERPKSAIVEDPRLNPMPTRSALTFVCLMLLAMTSAMAGSAVAQTRDKAREPDRERVDRGDSSRDTGRNARRSDSHRALSDAVRRVERRTGGQVLSAERVPYDGRDVNRVKIVDSSGRVRVYVDDPARGASEAPARGRTPTPSNRPVSTRRNDN